MAAVKGNMSIKKTNNVLPPLKSHQKGNFLIKIWSFHSHPPETGTRSEFFQHIQVVVVANSKCCHCRSATLLFLAPKGSNTINQSLMSCLVHFRRSPVASFHSMLSSVWMSQNKRLMVRPGSCPAVCL